MIKVVSLDTIKYQLNTIWYLYATNLYHFFKKRQKREIAPNSAPFVEATFA